MILPSILIYLPKYTNSAQTKIFMPVQRTFSEPAHFRCYNLHKIKSHRKHKLE